MRSDAPALLVVADRDHAGDDERWLGLIEEVGRAAIGRPVAIQVRARSASGDALRELAARARRAVPLGVPLLLNGDAALAVRLGYDGVHWPEAAIQAAAGGEPLRWRSAAVHSPAAARAAEAAGADWLVFGPVFAPRSKAGTGQGLDALRAVTDVTALPVLAIGGVTPERVPDCLRAGASGVAVVSGVLDTPSPARAIDDYLAALDRESASEGRRGAGRVG